MTPASSLPAAGRPAVATPDGRAPVSRRLAGAGVALAGAAVSPGLAAFACTAQCLLFPSLLGGFAAGTVVGSARAGLAVALVLAVALGAGADWRRHRRPGVLALFGAGGALVVGASCADGVFGTVLAVAGALVLVAGFVLTARAAPCVAPGP